ncbi:hypothetical protein M413DRAFT_31428 [Hebeloma cylindrosporum]|uniref:C2H2-type domain-containing protein n=1 Tax=Hebeloma cylindrosporum TaxID=76867 RepID=A0A0C3BZD4_HEBCY|nr:hypothetical protein M413DRAFT_31428 [Hebeloma cylindrosporum h7]
MSEANFVGPVDNVRRDPRDGAYHCPQCDTPFTRRSNLRRHFQIHMRSPLFKCENCGEEYTTKAELHSHALTCHSMAWNNVDEKAFRSVEDAYGRSTTYGGSGPLAVPPNGDGFVDARNYATPPTPFSNFESPEAQYNYHLMPALSSSGSVASPISPLMSSIDGNFTHPSSPPSAFSHRRPSTSSSNSSSSTHSSPYMYPTGHPQHTSYGYYPSTEVRPDNSLWNAVPPTTSTNAAEMPVYTRRQVKDMIDVVSECLIESMENVLTRPTSISPGGGYVNAAEGHLVHSIRDDGFRQTVLSEAIPRAYYRIRSGSGSNQSYGVGV